MDISIHLAGTLALCGTILLLAAAPTASSLLVLANTASGGLRSGFGTATGIAIADMLFALAAMVGLTAVISAQPDLFAAVQVICAIFLLWMASAIWRNRNSSANSMASSGARSGLIAGMLITFADQKAVLFYTALFPAFLNLKDLAAIDICVVAVLVGVSVLLPKMGYAVAAQKGSRLISDRWTARLRSGTAAILVLAAGYLVVTGVTSLRTLV